MTAFLPNIPNAGDFLDTTSQPQLRTNNQALDSRFGVDHYKFSDATGQSGKHNKVTTPIFIDSPPTSNPPVVIQTEPVIAAFQQTVPFGVLQYSYGWNVARATPQVPSPITIIQSSANPFNLAAGSFTTIMDFAGLAQAVAVVYAYTTDVSFSAVNTFTHITAQVFWNGTNFTITSNQAPPLANQGLAVNASGSTIRVQNVFTLTAIGSVFWSMQMLRMQ